MNPNSTSNKSYSCKYTQNVYAENHGLNADEAEFATIFSDFANGIVRNEEAVGRAIADDHRSVLRHKFQIMLGFVARMSENFKDGWFDSRDEYTARCCDVMMNALKKESLR